MMLRCALAHSAVHTCGFRRARVLPHNIRMLCPRRVSLRASVCAALLLWAGEAMAMPLDKASCDQLKAEKAALEGGGALAAMAKGAQWAKDNLKPEQLAQIQRMIDVDGQLLFRCNGQPLVVLPKEVEAEPDAAAVEGAKGTPTEGQQGTRQHDKAPAAAKAGAGAASGKAVAKKAVAQHAVSVPGKAKAKSKANDAYRPPQSDPGADPFATGKN
jgi:hypothetical protein